MEDSKELVPTQSKIIEGLKLDKDSTGRFTMPTLKQLYDAVIAWSLDEFKSIASTFRKERRAADTQRAYIDANRSFSDKLATLLEKSQRELLGKLGIEINDFEKSVSAYMEEGNQEIFELDATLPLKMTASLPSAAKSLEGLNFKDIMKKQIQYLEKNAGELRKYTLLTFGDEFPTIVQSKLGDFIYKKFGLEEEDLTAAIKSTPELLKDSEFQETMITFQQQLEKTIRI